MNYVSSKEGAEQATSEEEEEAHGHEGEEETSGLPEMLTAIVTRSCC
jgi:hypothetical protein